MLIDTTTLKSSKDVITLPVNELQTPLDADIVTALLEEEKELLLDYINSVPFINWMISPNRPYAKDLERDDKGRIIVDIVKPHIIEDMSYFTPASDHFRKYKCYTGLKPNSNPTSTFGKWFREELNRCWYGMVRPSDGEWIPGELYFYWNYIQIELSRTIKGTKRAERVPDFPEVWESTYLWAHYLHQARNGGLYDNYEGGKDAVIIARRGIGKSYFMQSLLARVFTVGLSAEESRQVRGVVAAYAKEYLTKDGLLNKFVKSIDFLSDHTHFPSARYRNSLDKMLWVMGYQDADSGVIRGTENEVIGLAIDDNPDKIRGKRSHLLIYEEFGAFPKFLDTWGTSEHNVREGEYSFGQRLAIGTGGSENSDFAGAIELINNPLGYNVYGVPNVFDRNSLGKITTIYFLGAYLNSKGYYNKDGVSDIVGALVSELKYRTLIKYNSSDPLALTKRRAEMPIVLQDAIMRRDGTAYPTADLTDAYQRINLDPSHYDKMHIGRLELSAGVVTFMPDSELSYIEDFPHKDNKLVGAICMKQLPQKDSTGKIPYGRYIAGIDVYDDDTSTTLSLGSLFVLDLWTDELVCEYTGRPAFADDFYENCRRILLFYSAEGNYENNKKGLFKYFSQHNALWLLSDGLEFLKDKDTQKENYGNKVKGTHAIEYINKYARSRIRDYLLKPVEETYEVEGEIITTTYKMLEKIPFKPLLQELALWNIDGNFDRHAALGMLMLLREDKLRLLGTEGPRDNGKNTDIEYLGNDAFFEKNYNSVANYNELFQVNKKKA